MTPARILIIKLSSLGDVLHSLPTATALRRAFPRAYIAWVVGPKAADIVTRHPGVDRVFGLGMNARPESRFVALPSWREAVAALRAERFDVSLDLQGLFRTALLAYAVRAPRRVGFRKSQEGLFFLCNLRVVPAREDIHAVHGYLQFARYLGADDTIVDFGLAELPEDTQWAQDFAAHRPGPAPLVAIAPGASAPRKRWSAQGFAETARALQNLGARVVVVGSRTDSAAAAAICPASAAEDLTGQTSLPELAALLRRCRLFIGNDSGPLHLAAAVGTPCISLFGPTFPLRTGPYGNHTVLTGPGALIERVAPDQVIRAAEAALAAT